MTGYEETDTDKVCKEILKQASNITVEEKWNLSYCDSDSQLYKDLFDNIQKLYKKAAEDGGLSEEFQGFESMEVSPVNKPDACDSSTKIARRPAVPLSLTPKKRAKRNVQKNVNTKKVNSDSDNLLVKTQIVMRRTDNYDSSTNSALEDAVKNVIVNTTFDDEMGLTVDENSVSVGGVQDENCDDTSLCKERAECYLQEDTTLGAMKAKCRCLEQYEDISPSLISGELCVEPCTGKYCSYAGKCIRNSTYLTRYCSCNEWRIGDTCGVDMVGILLGGGIAIGILTIALLTVLITAVTSRRRRRRRNEVTLERDIATPVTTTPQIRGIYRLPSDSQVRVEQEHPSELQVPAPGLLPPHRGSPEQSVRSDPVPVHRDPRSDAWFVSQNIPRPRLSL
ncbi:uncharacterized protein LOC123506781 [Portunus trituberculatus]|uniref:uncharacterized protein LOC123506781 n=1 Tax=Portunus trituberculatus TaxID=210409 RepID=UPI001E1D0302|nr:uncharacterized protein LOC123506781 [Portunus trituberculatus]